MMKSTILGVLVALICFAISLIPLCAIIEQLVQHPLCTVIILLAMYAVHKATLQSSLE